MLSIEFRGQPQDNRATTSLLLTPETHCSLKDYPDIFSQNCLRHPDEAEKLFFAPAIYWLLERKEARVAISNMEIQGCNKTFPGRTEEILLPLNLFLEAEDYLPVVETRC